MIKSVEESHNSPVSQTANLSMIEVSHTVEYVYPLLSPIAGPSDFDTVAKRLDWWQQLEPQWQAAFNVVSLKKAKAYQPNDEELDYILTSPLLRFVGPRGMHPNIDFELTNLSGVRHLKALTLLICTHQALTSLAGIEQLDKLDNLFVNANQLTNLKECYYLTNLTELHYTDNPIVDLQPLVQLTKLTLIHGND